VAAFPTEVDIAVIGAGAAGIGAARRLAGDASVAVVVLEARGRVGGRVHTIEPAGFPLDRGAEWLHSADRNPLSTIARALGFWIHQRPPEWTSRLRRSGETVEAEADWLATREAQARARREAAEELGVEGTPLRFLFRHRYTGSHGQAWGAVYEARWDGAVEPQASEVAWFAWVSPERLEQMLGELPFCADSSEIFERLRGFERGLSR